MEEKKRICKLCLLRDLAQEDQEKLEKYLERIRKEDRASDTEYERRLMICDGCGYLNGITCMACGCYAQFRALGRHARCPKKKW